MWFIIICFQFLWNFSSLLPLKPQTRNDFHIVFGYHPVIVRASIWLSTQQTSVRSRCKQILSFNAILPIGISHATDVLPTYITPYLEFTDSEGLFSPSWLRRCYVLYFMFSIPFFKPPSLNTYSFKVFAPVAHQFTLNDLRKYRISYLFKYNQI